MNFDAYIYELKLNYNKQKLINEGEQLGYTSGYKLLGRKRPAFKTLLEARIDNVNELKKHR